MRARSGIVQEPWIYARYTAPLISSNAPSSQHVTLSVADVGGDWERHQGSAL